MEINYIEKEGKKLFSFYRHDFKSFDEGEFIDGGFDYTRTGIIPSKRAEISEVIQDIREQFVWTSNLDENHKPVPPTTKLLKDLDIDHILSILTYVIEKSLKKDELNSLGWTATKLILLEELKFRNESTR